MKSLARSLMLAIVAATWCGGDAAAQDQPSGSPKVGTLVPLRVTIVMSRYQGEKRVSNLPYTLAVNANDGQALGTLGQFSPAVAQLRTGASVPVPSLGAAKDSPIQAQVGPVQYRSIGTNIDCSARSTDDGRFRLDISVEDTSVYSEGQSAQGMSSMSGVPSFRTFKTSNAVILRDGQSAEFTAAADRITGEVTKVVVTVAVVK